MMKFTRSMHGLPLFVSICQLTLYSVVALSKIYSLDDPRVAQTLIKGELILDGSDKFVKTRSRAKQGTAAYPMTALSREP
jgi:hypothetical protein